MYLREAWYVACWSRELGEAPLPVTILGEDLVIYRSAEGLAALENRCPHRNLPLHLGKVVGSVIRCGYHGMEIANNGHCVRVPSQKPVPPRARVRSYPIEDRYGWIWVWTGVPELADVRAIPDFSKLTDSRFAAVGKTNHVDASTQLMIDNLLDLSHVGFVHTSTIGNAQMGETGKIRVESTAAGVRVTRWVLDCAPPPSAVKTRRLPPGVNVDRWQIIDFVAPSFVMINVGNAETGTGAPEAKHDPARSISLWIMNAMTPKDERSCNYFWAAVRDYGLGDPQVDSLLFSQIAEAFDEDKHILEAQQRVINRRGDKFDVLLQADAGMVQARRYLEKAAARERMRPEVAQQSEPDAVSSSHSMTKPTG
jgi:phenylpropionate dioxygenase-like ring-hydroxylating dioxygenase large terminal subunit